MNLFKRHEKGHLEGQFYILLPMLDYIRYIQYRISTTKIFPDIVIKVHLHCNLVTWPRSSRSHFDPKVDSVYPVKSTL